MYTKGCNSHWTEAYLDAYHKAQIKIPQKTISLSDRYAPDPTQDNMDCFAIFVDAAFNSNTVFSTGFAIYDMGGTIWAVGYRRIPSLGTVMSAELQAIHNCINSWRSHNSGPFRILSVSTDAIHALHSEQTYKGVEKDIIKILKDQMKDPSLRGIMALSKK